MSENRILKTEVYKKEDLQARNEMRITVDLNDSNYRASTVAIGSVTTGPVPSVTNAGTPNAAILDIVLPKGDKGEAGASYDPTEFQGLRTKVTQIEGTITNLQAGSAEPVGYQELKTQVTTNKDALATLTGKVSSLETRPAGSSIIAQADEPLTGDIWIDTDEPDIEIYTKSEADTKFLFRSEAASLGGSGSSGPTVVTSTVQPVAGEIWINPDEPAVEVYSKTEVDSKFALKSELASAGGGSGQPVEVNLTEYYKKSEVYSKVDSDDKYATKAMIPVTYNKTQLDSMISALNTGSAGGSVVSGSTSVYKEFEAGKFPVLLPGSTAPVNPDLTLAPGGEALTGNNRWFKYTFKKAFSEVPVIQITTEVGALGTNPSLTLIGEVTKEYFTFKNNWYGAAIRINYSAFVARPASEVAAGGTTSGGTTVTLGSTFTEEEERKLKDIVINGVPSGGGSGTAAPVTPVFSDATDLTVPSSMHNRTVGLTATGTVTINLSSVPSGTSFKFLNVGSTKNVTFTGKTIIGQSAMNGDKGSAASILIYEGEAYITTSEKA